MPGIEKSGYTYEEHTSDVVIRTWAPTLEEAFSRVGEAVSNLMTDVSKVNRREKIEVTVEGMDLYNLLLRWVEEILYYFDSQQLLFSEVKVHEIKCDSRGCKLKATLIGEKYNPHVHESRTHVKAATYNMMEIKKKDEKWEIRLVVDI